MNATSPPPTRNEEWSGELFRAAVERLAQEKTLTLQEVARRAALSFGYFSHAASRHRSPRADAIVRIAVALGVPASQLFAASIRLIE